LGQADAGVQVQDGGDLAHRDAEPVMGGVRRGHHAGSDPVGGGPVLIGGQVRVRRPHRGLTGRAAVDPDAIGLHDRPGLRGDLGDRREVDPMLRHRLTAAGTDRLRESDLDGRGGPLVGPRQDTEGKVPLARLAPRAFRLGRAPALGEGGRRSLRVPLALFESGLQRGVLMDQPRDPGVRGDLLRHEILDTRFQRSEFREHLSDEHQECLLPQLCKLGERRHETDL
jgi:hypothetical protein